MIKPVYLLYAFLFLNLLSCKEPKTEQETKPSTENKVNADLKIDHLNIWVKNPQKAKKRLVDIGFTALPDSLSQVHEGQGTAGKYFNFLNCYLELIFVNDSSELLANVVKNKDMDFVERAHFEQSGASPISIALRMTNYDPQKIPFEKVGYRQDWMEEGTYIYAAKNSKKHLHEPSIFVVYPEIAVKPFETVEDLKKIPEEDAIWREFFKHANGAQHVTHIQITSTSKSSTTETIQTVNEVEGLEVKLGSKHLLELYFDNNVQGKTFDLQPELPLIVHL